MDILIFICCFLVFQHLSFWMSIFMFVGIWLERSNQKQKWYNKKSLYSDMYLFFVFEYMPKLCLSSSELVYKVLCSFFYTLPLICETGFGTVIVNGWDHFKVVFDCTFGGKRHACVKQCYFWKLQNRVYALP